MHLIGPLMTHRRSFIAGSLLALATGQAASAQILPGGYICPDCGCASDGKVFPGPGTCPSCGMPLVSQQTLQARPPKPKVAILVFPGVEIIDFCGPYEVFGQTGYEVFTVAAKAEPLSTSMKLQITPTYGIGASPPADILLIPGGTIDAAMHDKATLDWIRARHLESKITMSVCNGALILAQTGLLDNLTATTFHGAIDSLATGFPKVRVINDKRFVDNGKIITTAGLSSGIDGAMHVVSRLEGKVDAELIARQLEYDWNEDTTYARAVLADYPITVAFGDRLKLELPGCNARIESSVGDRTSWEAIWRVESKSDKESIVSDLVQRISRSFWKDADPVSGPTAQRSWRFKDPRNRNWLVQLHAADSFQPGVKRVMMTAILNA